MSEESYSDKHARIVPEMWFLIAGLLRDRAEAEARDGDVSEAIRLAFAADGCFWQATGEGDFKRLSEFIAPSAAREADPS